MQLLCLDALPHAAGPVPDVTNLTTSVSAAGTDTCQCIKPSLDLYSLLAREQGIAPSYV